MVKKRIKGYRVNTHIPAYTHSIRVAEMLKKCGFLDDVILSGLLHDIVEDGNTSIVEIERSFGSNVATIVGLCSHDMSEPNKDLRWFKMILRLRDAKNNDAWAVKIADIIDNLNDSVFLSDDRAWFMQNIKGPVILKLTRNHLGNTDLWKELSDKLYT